MFKLVPIVLMVVLLSAVPVIPARASDLGDLLAAAAAGFLAYELLHEDDHPVYGPPPPPPPPMRGHWDFGPPPPYMAPHPYWAPPPSYRYGMEPRSRPDNRDRVRGDRGREVGVVRGNRGDDHYGRDGRDGRNAPPPQRRDDRPGDRGGWR